MEKLHNKRHLAAQTMSEESAPIGNLMERSQKSQKYELMEKVNDVKEMIDRHRNQIHSNVTKNARETIAFLHQLQKKNTAIDANKRKPKVEPTKDTNSLAGLLEVWKLIRAPQTAVSTEQNDLNSEEFEGSEEITRRRRQDDGNNDRKDPEDEDLPPRPDIFIYNAFNGSATGLAKDNMEDQTGQASDPEYVHHTHKSDSAAFITHIVTTLVGVLTNAIASAALGSSGGSSHGVAGLFSGSAHSSSKSYHY